MNPGRPLTPYLFKPPLCKRGARGGFYKNSAQCGFTLVEIVLTLVILGMLATVAGPRFFDLSVFNERGFHDEVLSAVRFAQKYAVTSGRDVQFSVSGGGYALNQSGTGIHCTTPGTFTCRVFNPGTHTAFTGTAPSGVTLGMSPSTIIFDARGTVPAIPTGTAVVTVGGKSFTVYGATGFVHEP